MTAHDAAPSADDVRSEIEEFDRAMIALRLELPDLVWRDVWRRWMALRAQIDGSHE